MRTLARLKGALARRLSAPSPAPLREADWRFLLPNPEGKPWDHAVLLGGSAALARLVTEAGIARRVSSEIPAERSADALVIFGSRRGDLKRALTCLSPSGVLYAELPGWKLWTRRRAARIDRFLRSVGMSQVRTYGVRPSLTRREAYVPLDAEGPAAWLSDNVRGRKTSRFDLAVTAVGRDDAALPSLLGNAAVRGRLQSPGPRLLILTGGHVTDAYRRVVLLPFEPQARVPELVLKLWRSPERNPDTAEEQRILKEIRSEATSGAPGAVPEPLGSFPWGSLHVALESYCPGRSFAVTNSNRGRPERIRVEELREVLAGLAGFAGRTVIRREPWSASEGCARVEDALRKYEEGFPVTPTERRLFEGVRERSESLSRGSLPIVWSHPDLGPGNVLIRQDGITIIDWAKAAPGLPLQDFVYFLLVAGFEICRARNEKERLKIFRRLFLESHSAGDRLAAVAQEGVERCLHSVGTDRRSFPILLVLLWVNRSLGRLARSRAVARGAAGVNPKAGNPYPAYVRAVAERSEALFRRFETADEASSRLPIGLSETARSRTASH